MGSNWNANGADDATEAKSTGRNVRELNKEIEWAVAQAKRHVLQAMIESDPLKKVEALAVVLKELEPAALASRDIESICAAAAKRGTYSKEADDD
jgi:transcriptional regulator with AAA-type ATPase domain